MLATIIRTCIFYFLIIFAIRLMGKRQIGDMQPSELVITILISEIAAMPIQDIEMPISTGVAATVTLVLLEIAVSVIAMKSLNFRKLFYGSSAIIIKNGVIDQKMLRRLRVTGPDLMEVLRNQEIFDISQVAYAILETNGQLSVMLKPEYQNATVNDINGISSDCSMPCMVVSDGKFLNKAINSLNVSKTQLEDHLRSQGLRVKDVFIMTCDEEGRIDIVKKE